jgi:hypothetical protein
MVLRKPGFTPTVALEGRKKRRSVDSLAAGAMVVASRPEKTS